MEIKKTKNIANNFFQSKAFTAALLGIAAFLALLFAFKAGMIVGAKKAEFSHRWSDNYQRNFAGPRSGFPVGFGDRDFIEANGVFGQIIKIDGQTLMIKSRDDVEKIVLISKDAVIRQFQDSLKLADLKTDDYIVVIGEPNDSGQIEAKLIRIMPPQPLEEAPRPFPLFPRLFERLR